MGMEIFKGQDIPSGIGGGTQNDKSSTGTIFSIVSSETDAKHNFGSDGTRVFIKV